jgi:putative heme-binding domain-containing protein
MIQLGLPAILSGLLLAALDGSTTLQDQLSREGATALARVAISQGDPRRGAIVFFRPQLLCATCHVQDKSVPALGPDLAAPGKTVTGAELVEAILAPSKVIRKGYESVTVVTKEGKAFTGRVLEDRADAIVLFESGLPGKAITIARADIDERRDKGPSLMPEGMVNQLGSRQEFLDLIRYLTEIAERGPARERELRPDAAAMALAPLPEYENDLDHSGFISGWSAASFKRGGKIYDRVCANCHGTNDRAGSLPSSLRFASGTFKNGADPYRMYQTLTRGFGQMPPQTWMVPVQKYDVIHYIRERYLRSSNPSQYARVDPDYLGGLPKGRMRGPAPIAIEPWIAMDYGASLMATVEAGDDGANIAYKGIAVRLDPGPGGISRGRAWSIFEHGSLRLAASWTGEQFIDWEGINFNGKHQVHPQAAGLIRIANPTGPGWADPETGSFDDPRPKGRDGRPYGPLPRRWAHYRGVYHNGNRVVLSYTVGTTNVLETPGLSGTKALPIFTRSFEIGPRERDLVLQVAHQRAPLAILRTVKTEGPGEAVVFGSQDASGVIAAGVSLTSSSLAWRATPSGDLRLGIARGRDTIRFKLRLTGADQAANLLAVASELCRDETEPTLESLTHGGPPRWGTVLSTRAEFGASDGPFAVDVLTIPESNPWLCQMRLTGLDFLPGGKQVVLCTWDGDVWEVDGAVDRTGTLAWRRVASGLFQPLGIKVVGGQIYVACRDQIVILRDLNGDRETDFYENFNSDHQVTEHFHEFAMDLQTDSAGNFYYTKAARHALTALVPQHGTLLRVSPDGARTEILATGFRAPNGVCVNPDGTFFLTDQEGFWLPKNRINWVRPGSFHGNMWGYHGVTDPSDAAMEPPVCWITNSFDRSPGEIVRVEGDGWGALKGSLLNLSYGYGKIFAVLCERVGDQMQGGMATLPIPQFPTGIMRGRFHPGDGQLYTCGMYAWAGNQTQPGGFYRVRYTGKPVVVPVRLAARRDGIAITFTGALDRSASTDPRAYTVRVWGLERSANYGSEHFDEHALTVRAAKLSGDGRTVELAIPDLAPTWCMAITYAIKAESGSEVAGEIHNTIHKLGADAVDAAK